jgi:hypothetical protein
MAQLLVVEDNPDILHLIWTQMRARATRSWARHRAQRPWRRSSCGAHPRSRCWMWPCRPWTDWSCSSSCVPPPACRSCQRSSVGRGRPPDRGGGAPPGCRLPGQALHGRNLVRRHRGGTRQRLPGTPGGRRGGHTDRVVPSRACQRFARSRVSRSPAVHHSSIADRTNHLRCREAGRSVALLLEGAAPL